MKRFFACCLLFFAAIAQGAHEGPAVGRIEAYFVPWDDAEGAILRAIEAARNTIHVQAYVLTSRNIARALHTAHRRGVRVALLVDQERAQREASWVFSLAAAGIPVWLETRFAAAHNKIILIDAESEEPVIITGSYNFSSSAQTRNAENLLILRGNRDLARAYYANWLRHRSQARLLQE
ncbi:MAG: phospholipase D family protein [Rhodocyclaceae bacterium]|nr:phospholipase D family protein [Rhodocyclaceae bacterium]